MTIGILKLELYFPYSHSLKEKRSVLKKIEAQIRNKHNVSVSEVNYQDKWARSVLAIVNVSSSSKVTNQILGSIEPYIEKHFQVQILGQSLELI